MSFPLSVLLPRPPTSYRKVRRIVMQLKSWWTTQNFKLPSSWSLRTFPKCLILIKRCQQTPNSAGDLTHVMMEGLSQIFKNIPKEPLTWDTWAHCTLSLSTTATWTRIYAFSLVAYIRHIPVGDEQCTFLYDHKDILAEWGGDLQDAYVVSTITESFPSGHLLSANVLTGLTLYGKLRKVLELIAMQLEHSAPRPEMMGLTTKKASRKVDWKYFTTIKLPRPH